MGLDGINSSKVYCKCVISSSPSLSSCGINSSKVYCKLYFPFLNHLFSFCINSSKVYCKSLKLTMMSFKVSVLIVAKCIVNFYIFNKLYEAESINSSKVYCKLLKAWSVLFAFLRINSSKVYCKFA